MEHNPNTTSDLSFDEMDHYIKFERECPPVIMAPDQEEEYTIRMLDMLDVDEFGKLYQKTPDSPVKPYEEIVADDDLKRSLVLGPHKSSTETISMFNDGFRDLINMWQATIHNNKLPPPIEKLTNKSEVSSAKLVPEVRRKLLAKGHKILPSRTQPSRSQPSRIRPIRTHHKRTQRGKRLVSQTPITSLQKIGGRVKYRQKRRSDKRSWKINMDETLLLAEQPSTMTSTKTKWKRIKSTKQIDLADISSEEQSVEKVFDKDETTNVILELPAEPSMVHKTEETFLNSNKPMDLICSFNEDANFPAHIAKDVSIGKPIVKIDKCVIEGPSTKNTVNETLMKLPPQPLALCKSENTSHNPSKPFKIPRIPRISNSSPQAIAYNKPQRLSSEMKPPIDTNPTSSGFSQQMTHAPETPDRSQFDTRDPPVALTYLPTNNARLIASAWYQSQTMAARVVINQQLAMLKSQLQNYHLRRSSQNEPGMFTQYLQNPMLQQTLHCMGISIDAYGFCHTVPDETVDPFRSNDGMPMAHNFHRPFVHQRPPFNAQRPPFMQHRPPFNQQRPYFPHHQRPAYGQPRSQFFNHQRPRLNQPWKNRGRVNGARRGGQNWQSHSHWGHNNGGRQSYDANAVAERSSIQSMKSDVGGEGKSPRPGR